MSPRWLTRALVALAVPALVVPALATPAQAAKAPELPSAAKTAKIYPHIDESYESTSDVRGHSKKCGKQGPKIKGASSAVASYMDTDSTTYQGTGKEPNVFASAMRFKSAKSAINYLHGTGKTVKCPVTNPGGGEDIKVKLKKIKFNLGDERQGWTSTYKYDGTTMISHYLLVREGKFIITTGISSSDGKEPALKQALKFTKLAVNTAS